jgi:hypothetical protein
MLLYTDQVSSVVMHQLCSQQVICLNLVWVTGHHTAHPLNYLIHPKYTGSSQNYMNILTEQVMLWGIVTLIQPPSSMPYPLHFNPICSFGDKVYVNLISMAPKPNLLQSCSEFPKFKTHGRVTFKCNIQQLPNKYAFKKNSMQSARTLCIMNINDHQLSIANIHFRFTKLQGNHWKGNDSGYLLCTNTISDYILYDLFLL